MPEWLRTLLQAEVPLFFLVILRLVVGGELVAQGYDKIQQGYVRHFQSQATDRINPLKLYVDSWIEQKGSDDKGILPWYKTFLEKAVQPNLRTFATVVTAGELAIGALLILGLMVRVASILGILMILNYLFATWHLGFPWMPLNILFLALLAVFALASAGRCLGLDALLHERFPEIPLF